MAWTEFWDMHSGGSQKERFHLCYIEAPESVACVVFYNRFGHNPHRVTCTCCGSDYSVSESETLEEATSYHRGGQWDDTTNTRVGGSPLEEFFVRDDVCILRAENIKPEETEGELPQQGYVWQD